MKMSANPYEFDAPGAEWDRVIVTQNNKGQKHYIFAKADYTGHYNLLKMSQKLDDSNKYYLPRMFINQSHEIQFADKKDDTPENRQLLDQESSRIKLEHQKFVDHNTMLIKAGKDPYGSSFEECTKEDFENILLLGLSKASPRNANAPISEQIATADEAKRYASVNFEKGSFDYRNYIETHCFSPGG